MKAEENRAHHVPPPPTEKKIFNLGTEGKLRKHVVYLIPNLKSRSNSHRKWL